MVSPSFHPLAKLLHVQSHVHHHHSHHLFSCLIDSMVSSLPSISPLHLFNYYDVSLLFHSHIHSPTLRHSFSDGLVPILPQHFDPSHEYSSLRSFPLLSTGTFDSKSSSRYAPPPVCSRLIINARVQTPSRRLSAVRNSEGEYTDTFVVYRANSQRVFMSDGRAATSIEIKPTRALHRYARRSTTGTAKPEALGYTRFHRAFKQGPRCSLPRAFHQNCQRPLRPHTPLTLHLQNTISIAALYLIVCSGILSS